MKWFVYAVDCDDKVVYVGKGSHSRDTVSAKRLDGEPMIVERFAKEQDAFDAERLLIRQINPIHNKTNGGDGGRSKRRLVRRKTAIEREMDRIGTRAFTARMMLESFPYMIEPSKVTKYIEVANYDDESAPKELAINLVYQRYTELREQINGRA